MSPDHMPCFSTSPDDGRLCQKPAGHGGDHHTSGPGYSCTWSDKEGGQSPAANWSMAERWAPPHECEPIADFGPRMTGRRELWVGEIIEPPPGFDWEGYCIHIVSGVKPEFVWCVNEWDLHYLAAAIDATDQMPVRRWLDKIVEFGREEASNERG